MGLVGKGAGLLELARENPCRMPLPTATRASSCCDLFGGWEDIRACEETVTAVVEGLLAEGWNKFVSAGFAAVCA